MNILAIDYGKKRIGLAWMQAGLDIVLPFGVIETENWKLEIEKIVIEENIDRIVVGYPLKVTGEDTDSTDAVVSFVSELKNLVSVPVETVDERFTTAQAKQMDGEASLDEKAAMLILQTYVDKRS